MSPPPRASDARERILAAALELFYRQGYRATGVNELIERAGVAKATFFRHFPSKEDLALAYLDRLHETEAADLGDYVSEAGSPRERFLAVIRWIEPWIRRNGLRGCGFINIVPEIPDRDSPIRERARGHYEVLRGLLKKLADELVSSDGERYGHLDPAELADRSLVVVVGSIALSEISMDPWPARTGPGVVEALLDG